MSKIFELFGFPLADDSSVAKTHRTKAWCPYMNAPCDGGGNRYLSNIQLDASPLRALYPGRESIPAGVCSLQLKPQHPPWIVCPRRLLALTHTGSDEGSHQNQVKHSIISRLDYPPGTRLGVWSEVKMKFASPSITEDEEADDDEEDEGKSFDYSFDFVLMPLARVPLARFVSDGILPAGPRGKKMIQEAGYLVEGNLGLSAAQVPDHRFVDFDHDGKCDECGLPRGDHP